jgi:hypothetical protein
MGTLVDEDATDVGWLGYPPLGLDDSASEVGTESVNESVGDFPLVGGYEWPIEVGTAPVSVSSDEELTPVPAELDGPPVRDVVKVWTVRALLDFGGGQTVTGVPVKAPDAVEVEPVTIPLGVGALGTIPEP